MGRYKPTGSVDVHLLQKASVQRYCRILRDVYQVSMDLVRNTITSHRAGSETGQVVGGPFRALVVQ